MRAKMMCMNERNPRSKLRQMKRRYFAATAIVYLVLFFIAYLVCEMLFMILEAAPYTKLAVLLMVLVIDGVVTDYIINTRMKNRWRREAPDILDEIKAPEPAYIPDGPVNPAPSDQEKPAERKRLRRTQHKELENEQRSASMLETKPVKETAESIAPVKPEKKGLKGLFQRKNKTASSQKESSSSSAAPAVSESKPKSDDKGSFMKSIEEMDTVEFEDAVIDLEHRVVNQYNTAVKDHVVRRTRSQAEEMMREEADASELSAAHAEQQNERPVSSESDPQAQPVQHERKPRRIPESPVKAREPKQPQPSSSSAWSSPIDEMETVGITEAVSRIQEAEADRSVKEVRRSAAGKRAKQRIRRRSSK